MVTRFVLGRALTTIPVIFAAVAFTFVALRLLPADPAAFLASGPGMGPDEIAALRAQLGLDHSIATQFVLYLGQVLHLDLGRSTMTGQPVLHDLLRRLPASLELAVGGLLLACAFGLPLGIAAAARPRSLLDHTCRVVAALGGALPAFVTGLALIYVFYVRLDWAPEPVGQLAPLLSAPPVRTGFLPLDAALAGDGVAFGSALRHLLLPCLTMALFALGPIARITRATMLSALSSDYIRSARALGLPPGVVLHYAFANAALPIVTTLGLTFSYMLGANVVVEKVFAWPGLGSYAVDALQGADYAALQGFVLVVAAVFACVNVLVDVLSGALDPRARWHA
jgi:ABC-type dipeptide/oligopeptide/nickel transport system permease component